MNHITDKRLRAEAFGTFCLVLIGCASIVLTGFNTQLPMGFMAIGIAFGMTMAVMAYTVGPISGFHLNPAVTAAMWSAGRINGGDAIAYVAAQFVGAIVASFVLFVIVLGRSTGWSPELGLGATGWAQYSMWSAIVAELVGTLIFTLIFLAVTGPRGAGPLAGIIVGLTLMLIHFAFIFVSGASVNPARSFGPALFSGAKAIGQVWMYLVVPTIGGLLAGWLVKSKTFDL